MAPLFAVLCLVFQLLNPEGGSQKAILVVVVLLVVVVVISSVKNP